MKSASLVLIFAIVLAALVTRSHSSPIVGKIAKEVQKTGKAAGKIVNAAGNAIQNTVEDVAKSTGKFFVGVVVAGVKTQLVKAKDVTHDILKVIQNVTADGVDALKSLLPKAEESLKALTDELDKAGKEIRKAVTSANSVERLRKTEAVLTKLHKNAADVVQLITNALDFVGRVLPEGQRRNLMDISSILKGTVKHSGSLLRLMSTNIQRIADSPPVNSNDTNPAA